MKKVLFLSFIFIFVISFFLTLATQASASWVSGYFKDNGTYVNGYYRTEPNYYKWDNYSWDGDWSDSLNDKSWYRDYGYDPEPYDNEIPNYDYWSGNSYKWDSYDYNGSDYSYDSYDSNDYSYDSWDYDYSWGW